MGKLMKRRLTNKLLYLNLTFLSHNTAFLKKQQLLLKKLSRKRFPLEQIRNIMRELKLHSR